MRLVMKAIFATKKIYATLPLFDFMRDEKIPPRDRLAFYPCMARFILDFGDLNKYVMRDESSSDPHQLLVNAHTYEDDHHWPWYLEDFAALGFDQARPCTEMLTSLYGDDTSVNRLLMTRLAHLLYDATPTEKLVIIEAIEETGNVLFALTAQLARRLEAERGISLKYLGDFHFNLETGHAMNGADHRELAAITLSPTERERCLMLVERVFGLFGEWTDELLAYARRDLKMGELAKRTSGKASGLRLVAGMTSELPGN